MSLNSTIRERNSMIHDYQEMVLDCQKKELNDTVEMWREIDSISKIIMSYE